jgi:hypothetical protein
MRRRSWKGQPSWAVQKKVWLNGRQTPKVRVRNGIQAKRGVAQKSKRKTSPVGKIFIPFQIVKQDWGRVRDTDETISDKVIKCAEAKAEQIDQVSTPTQTAAVRPE